MKQKIGVDMDSVLAEIMGPLTGYAQKHHGMTTNSGDHFSYGLHEVWGVTPEKAMEIVYEYYKSKEFERAKPVKGAVAGVTYLAQKYDLVVITSRPFWVENKTLAWVEKNFDGKFAKILHTNQFSVDVKQKKKSQVCLEEGIGLMIDDSWEVAVDCADNGIQVYLMTMPWNKKYGRHNNITRVSGWNEIQKLL